MSTPVSTPERQKKIKGDRFIPCTVRRALFQTSQDNSQDDSAGAYSQALRTELFGDPVDSIFGFSNPTPATPCTTSSASSVSTTPCGSEATPMSCDGDPTPSTPVPSTPPRPASSTPKMIPSPGYLPRHLDFPVCPSRTPGSDLKPGRQRKVNATPTRILDAPGLVDNFYMDVLDFGANNYLLVALMDKVYLWNAETFQITMLTTVQDTYVSSVRWMDGNMVAIGTACGKVQVLDAATCNVVNTVGNHTDRVGCLAWNPMLGILGSGSRDSRILFTDTRAGVVQEFTHHSEEVCGLRWSPDGSCASSGGNDNMMCIWNTSMTQKPLLQTHLQAAVKAMAWSPHAHGLLACGGGSADRRIHFYNSASGAALADVDTGAQVCNLLWAANTNELVSTHGYQHNNIIIWKYPRLSQVATLTGHASRVLWLTGSPDGQTIVTGAADETLRFWEVFPPARQLRSAPGSSALSLSIALSSIR